jgi:DNA-directed RNA polymerase specialized sigma24 family protein
VDDAAELEKVYRQEATRIRAMLAARLGDIGLAEELVHDAFVEALEHWPGEGLPPSPGGWLATTAWRKALDRLRRDRAGQEELALLAVTDAAQAGRGGHAEDPLDVAALDGRENSGAAARPVPLRDGRARLRARVGIQRQVTRRSRSHPRWEYPVVRSRPRRSRRVFVSLNWSRSDRPFPSEHASRRLVMPSGRPEGTQP